MRANISEHVGTGEGLRLAGPESDTERTPRGETIRQGVGHLVSGKFNEIRKGHYCYPE